MGNPLQLSKLVGIQASEVADAGSGAHCFIRGHVAALQALRLVI